MFAKSLESDEKNEHFDEKMHLLNEVSKEHPTRRVCGSGDDRRDKDDEQF